MAVTWLYLPLTLSRLGLRNLGKWAWAVHFRYIKFLPKSVRSLAKEETLPRTCQFNKLHSTLHAVLLSECLFPGAFGYNSMKTLMVCYSVAQLCLTLCDPMDCSTPGFPVLHDLLKFAQTQVLWVNDAIQPPHSLSSPSPPAFNLSQHHSLFQWVCSSNQVAKVLELQLQHWSFQRMFRVDFL